MLRTLFIATLLLLGACAGQGGPVVAGSPASAQSLADFTVADLQAASADAKAQTPVDDMAAQCYDYLAAVIPTLKVPGQGQSVGAFVAFQHARDLANGVSAVNGVLKGINKACAPLVIDAQTTVNKLLVLGAAVIH